MQHSELLTPKYSLYLTKSPLFTAGIFYIKNVPCGCGELRTKHKSTHKAGYTRDKGIKDVFLYIQVDYINKYNYVNIFFIDFYKKVCYHTIGGNKNAT